MKTMKLDWKISKDQQTAIWEENGRRFKLEAEPCTFNLFTDSLCSGCFFYFRHKSSCYQLEFLEPARCTGSGRKDKKPIIWKLIKKPKPIEKTIPHAELIKILEGLKQTNALFSVSFIKKDLSVRKLNGMFNVKKALKGGKLGYKPETAEKFFIIYDMKKKDYRAVNKETIFEVRTNGITYVAEK